MFAAAIIAFLIAALLLLVIIRMLFGGRLRMPGGRTRQARLGIVDAFDLDRQRQLIIVRRDNTEHLIMIGGPNDLLIESEIIRVEARDQREGRRDKLDVPAPMLPIPAGGPEPRIPAPFAPVERVESAPRPQDIEPAPPSFSLADQPLPSTLPPPVSAAAVTIGDARPAQADPVPQPPRAPTFPLPPRRPQPPVVERRPPGPPRPLERPVRTEPAPPSLDTPPASPLEEPTAPAAPVPPQAAPTPPTPPARPVPPPFLRPLPPRTPKVLQRTTPSAPTPPPSPAPQPAPAAPAAEVEPAPPPAPPAPVVAPQPPPPPVAAASPPNDTLESLEEEMAKLLGRGTGE